MASSEFFNRTYELTINGKGIDITITKLDINFDIKFYTGPRVGQASINIIGLSYDTISLLEPFTVVSPGALMNNNPIKVSLRAGYDDKNDLLFDGFLYSVSISEPPELAVSISARAYRSISDLERKSISTENGVKIKEVAEVAFSMFNINFVNQSHANAEMKIGAKVITGDVVDFMRAIQQMAKWYLTYIPSENVVFADDEFPHEAYETIDKTRGLLGVPSVNVYSANICTWLRVDTPCVGRLITLNSQLHPSANGRYKVLCLQYKGEYRGKSWYTMYNGIRERS